MVSSSLGLYKIRKKRSKVIYPKHILRTLGMAMVAEHREPDADLIGENNYFIPQPETQAKKATSDTDDSLASIESDNTDK